MISNGQANSALHAVQFTKHPICFDLLIVLREEKLSIPVDSLTTVQKISPSGDHTQEWYSDVHTKTQHLVHISNFCGPLHEESLHMAQGRNNLYPGHTTNCRSASAPLITLDLPQHFFHFC
jgi:hypothetical protein